MPEHQPFELDERWRWVDPQLGHQRLARLPVGGQGIGLASASIQRKHLQSAQALAQRVRMYQRVQVRYQCRVPAEPQIGVEPVLQARQAHLLQPGGVGKDGRLVGEVGQRVAAPQPERLTQQLRRLLVITGIKSGAASLPEILKTSNICPRGVEAEPVAGRLADDHGRR